MLNDETGRPLMDGTSVENALAGAVLLDLVNSGRVGTSEDGRKLLVIDPSPLGDQVLDTGLSRLDGPVKPQRAVEKLRKGVRAVVLDQLAGRGLVRREKSKVLGLFPRTDWPAVDSSHEDAGAAAATS